PMASRAKQGSGHLFSRGAFPPGEIAIRGPRDRVGLRLRTRRATRSRSQAAPHPRRLSTPRRRASEKAAAKDSFQRTCAGGRLFTETVPDRPSRWAAGGGTVRESRSSSQSQDRSPVRDGGGAASKDSSGRTATDGLSRRRSKRRLLSCHPPRRTSSRASG